MEKERLSREAEEKGRAERMKRIQEEFDDPKAQWEKDKTDIQDLVLKAKEKAAEEKAQVTSKRPAAEGSEQGPKAAGEKESTVNEKTVKASLFALPRL